MIPGGLSQFLARSLPSGYKHLRNDEGMDEKCAKVLVIVKAW